MIVLLAGCGSDTEEPPERPSSTSTSSQEPDPVVHTVDEMAWEPCRAIDDHLARSFEISDPTEVDLDIGPSCQWQSAPGALSLTAYPTVDLTQDRDVVRDMEGDTLDGHGAFKRMNEDDGSVEVIVSTAYGQSLRVRGTATSDTRDLLVKAKSLAAGAANNLR